MKKENRKKCELRSSETARSTAMSAKKVIPTQNEMFFEDHEIIVSKTDPRGIITYANDVFQRVAGYTEEELLGQPHNLIRHPDMPACVFKLLWDTIKSGKEIFAYVKNMARNGDHYWVFAHVTPSYDANGSIVGYHSNRRVPSRDALDKIQPVYAQLRDIELQAANPRDGMNQAFEQVVKLLEDSETDYSNFVFNLSEETQLCHALD